VRLGSRPSFCSFIFAFFSATSRPYMLYPSLKPLHLDDRISVRTTEQVHAHTSDGLKNAVCSGTVACVLVLSSFSAN
jgi:hypothetical protein